MTIKELEERSGLERATIRFYEKEGLLSPKRLDNGYRDYSEAELELLLRVRLLRDIHLPLDEIRALKEGTLSMEKALSAQQQRLSDEQKDADRAGRICRSIRADGVTFDKLDPKKYITVEDPKAPIFKQTEPDPYRQKADQLPRAFYPWRRYFARSLDLLIYDLLWSLVLVFVFRAKITQQNFFISLLYQYVVYGMMLLIEPLLLHFFGWTPGKLLLGLRVEGQNGRLTLSEAFARTKAVFGEGMGYGIPGYSLYKQWQAYKRLSSDNRPTDWDVDLPYFAVRDISVYRGIGYVGSYAAIIAAAVLASQTLLLPPNRGDLTIAEFAENFNYYADYLEYDFGEDVFTAEGRWEKRPEPGVVVIDVFADHHVDPVYTLSGDAITGLSYTLELEGDQGWISTGSTRMLLYTLAFAGAQEDFSIFSSPYELEARIGENIGKSFSFDEAGLSVKHELESRGYWWNEMMAIPEEGADLYLYQRFSITK